MALQRSGSDFAMAIQQTLSQAAQACMAMPTIRVTPAFMMPRISVEDDDSSDDEPGQAHGAASAPASVSVTMQPSPCRRTRRTPDENKEIVIAAGRDVDTHCSRMTSQWTGLSQEDAVALMASFEAQQNKGAVFADNEDLVSLCTETQ